MLHPHVNEKHLYSLRGIAIELATIICSILLALQFEDCHQRHEHQKLAREALQAFRDELTTNRTHAYETLYDDRKRLETLTSMLERMQKGEDVFGNFGVGLGPLTTGAWDTALATQALTYLPYEKAKVIAQIYSGQRLEEGLIHGALAPLSLAATQHNETLSERIKFFRVEESVLQSVTGNYAELVDFYDQAIPEL